MMIWTSDVTLSTIRLVLITEPRIHHVRILHVAGPQLISVGTEASDFIPENGHWAPVAALLVSPQSPQMLTL